MNLPKAARARQVVLRPLLLSVYFVEHLQTIGVNYSTSLTSPKTPRINKNPSSNIPLVNNIATRYCREIIRLAVGKSDVPSILQSRCSSATTRVCRRTTGTFEKVLYLSEIPPIKENSDVPSP